MEQGCVMGVRRNLAAAVLAAVLPGVSAWAAPVNEQLFVYQSTLSSDQNGPLDLTAELNYDSGYTDAPIAVLMHVFSLNENALEYNRAQAQHLRDKGFFVVTVAMRGRAGADGVRDTGGLEIYDIYDAVEAVRANFADKVDDGNVHITGYSGGGGNVMSALTKFPDMFRLGSSFFGMSDYGYDPVTGWYHDGANLKADGSQVSPPRTDILDADIGDPTTGDPLVLDRYLARASNYASKNNPYSEIHLFYNSDELISPPVNNTSYRDMAVAAASFPGEFDNIILHEGDSTGGTYVDFDGSGTNDPDEQQNWVHGPLSGDAQDAGEQWYVGRLLDGSIPQPVLNTKDELFVAGFVVTRPFRLFLGSGEDTAGALKYELSPSVKTFALDILTSDLTKTGVLNVDTADMAGQSVELRVNGVRQDTFIGGGVYEVSGFGDGGSVVLSLISALLADVDLDGDVDDGDIGASFSNFTGPLGASGGRLTWEGDFDGDGDVDDVDLAAAFSGFTGPTPGQSVTVPEPGGLVLLGVGAVLLSERRRV